MESTFLRNFVKFLQSRKNKTKNYEEINLIFIVLNIVLYFIM